MKNYQRVFLLLLTIGLTRIFGTAQTGKATCGGSILDAAVYRNLLVTGTDQGTVDVFLSTNLHKKAGIRFEEIKDFYDEPIRPKVFSVDIYGKKKTVILSIVESEGGQCRLVRSDLSGTSQKTLIAPERGLQMRKVRFVDKHTALIALISSECILYDLTTLKIKYRVQISQSLFSDFALNQTRTEAAFVSESGDIQIVRVRDGKILKTLSGGNKDNIFNVSYRAGRLLTGGRDKKAVLYNLTDNRFRIFETPFYVYAVAIDNRAEIMAFVTDENSRIDIRRVHTGERITRLPAINEPVNRLIFTGDHHLLVCDDAGHIYKWRIK